MVTITTTQRLSRAMRLLQDMAKGVVVRIAGTHFVKTIENDIDSIYDMRFVAGNTILDHYIN